MIPVLLYVQKLAGKLLDFSVYTPEPETILIRGKADPLRLFLPIVHEK